MGKGAALRGFGAILKKAKPSYPKAKPRGTPTKAGLVARRNELRGETIADKFKRRTAPKAEPVKKKPIIPEFEKGVGTGAVLTLALAKLKESKKVKKEAEAKQDKKIKKALEEHKKADKKKKESYGKRAPKKDKYYGGR
jgi:hypothetical protein